MTPSTTGLPSVVANDLPHLTGSQMIEVDRVMVQRYGIDLARMMENAGRGLAHLIRHRYLDGDAAGRSVIVLAGSGGNGGGALVAARRLHGYGARVRVFATRPAGEMPPVPASQAGILHEIGVPISRTSELQGVPPVDVLVDGVIGYSLRGDPRGEAARAIRWANQRAEPTISLDLPSGIDATSGRPADPVVAADATLTLALPKEGLRARSARPLVGDLFLADIGVPSSLYSEEFDFDIGPVFSVSDVVRVA